MILIIDNYDSFVYNLARYFENANQDVLVVRNDKINTLDIKQLNPTHIVISPGPGTPDNAGISLALIKEFYATIPILGVCLGHQAIGQVFGAKTTFAKYPMHGKASAIIHNEKSIFKSLNNPIFVGRYHSLIVSDIPDNSKIEVIAKSLEGEVMAIKHKVYPVYGVQFHPESILTECGTIIINNFLNFIL